ncbi:glycosyltransferase [Salinicoccus carnicancri]|uniref:glycosyltransferase n=1 Tax=Salinicoccus carnicancri TaxID=558170 RepID=UPI0002D9C6F8|nr:glycosyltransferase family A protein [Salinicoccus carnicancri]
MGTDIFDYKNIDRKNVGIITNFFSKQFLEREFMTFQIPYDNFREYLKINNISIVFIDNEIYETDHVWFNKELNGLMAYLKLNNIDIRIIKNSNRNIPNSLMQYPIVEIDIDHRARSEKNMSLPIIINEKRFNPIKSIKKLDVLYLRKGKIIRPQLIQKFHDSLNPAREEVVYHKITRKFLLGLLEKIKESKFLYIYDAQQMDPVFLRYIELISVLQNTVVFYTGEKLVSEYAFTNNISYNINYMAIMKEDTHFIDKLLLPLQRKVFLNHTFVNRDSIEKFQYESENTFINKEISVITSTNRKKNLSDYIKQMNEQRLVKLQVILVTHGFTLTDLEMEELSNQGLNFELEVIEAPEHLPLGYCLNTAISKVRYPYVAKMDDDDYYFENYLIDSWIAAKYTEADLVGKLSTYTYLEGSKLIISKHKNTRRKYNDFVMGATFFSKTSLMKKYMFSYLSTGEDSDFLKRINEDKVVIYADHPYNFCIYRSNDISAHTWKISDLEFMKNSKIESYDIPEKFLSF